MRKLRVRQIRIAKCPRTRAMFWHCLATLLNFNQKRGVTVKQKPEVKADACM